MPVEKYLKSIRKYVPMTKPEEQEWFKKAKGGNRLAYKHIIQSNLRFVVSVAKHYTNNGVEFEDLIAEGNCGLLKAYEKFDPSKNFKFITYAVWWIRQFILTSIHDNSRNIRIPTNKLNSISKISKLKERVEQELSRSLYYEELIDYLDNPSALKDLKHAYYEIKLDRPNSDNESDLNNIIPDEYNCIFKQIEKTKDEIKEIIKDFPVREKDIIQMYYGIGHIRAYTLKEIGIDLGLTRERIRQIKEKVLEKLREHYDADKLRAYLD